jgi:hypothetical protein
MRILLIGAVVVGLSACVAAEAPPVVFANTGWRTSSGVPVSIGEIDALRQSCVPRRTVTPIDSDRPVPNPLRDNPAYHPGGEGLTNAPPTGIAAADQRIDTAARRSAEYGAGPIEDCLSAKGLVRAR